MSTFLNTNGLLFLVAGPSNVATLLDFLANSSQLPFLCEILPAIGFDKVKE